MIYDSEVETIRYEDSKGYILNNDLTLFDGIQSFTNGDAKAIEKIEINGKTHWILFNASSGLTFLYL